MRILLIATYLPPYNGSGNIRLLNYINYLNRLGNKVDVVGVDYPKNSIAYDETLEDVFDKEVDVYRVKPGFLYNLFNRKKVNVYTENEQINLKSNKNELINKFKYKLNYFIKTTLLIPDSFVGWIKPAYKTACNLIENNRYDLIFTIHETPSSHIVGYKLKKRFKDIKWVGYWSDPWNGDSALRKNNSIFKAKIEENLERKIVLNVDKLLFTTKGTCNMYINKYNLDIRKTDVVYRGYDNELYNTIEKDNDKPLELLENKINIVHTGTIYKELRDIRPLYEGLKKLKEKKRDIYDKLNFIFLGQFTDESDKKLLGDLSCVTIINSLPFKVAMRYVVFADILLLYGNKNSSQVPGKVYEYLGSKAKVLTILGSEYDELKDIMQKISKGPIINNNEEEIYNSVIDLYYKINNNENLEWNKACDLFLWDKVAKDLEGKIST